ncbi:MAG: Glycerate 2-kinase [Candidatus Dichloromethanomonas elyunquensis]|nr:MAG: Glycerate 2-kinase [Candidatus Dichloromethanomonas elyunquensis]
MKVLVASDSFKGSLSSIQVGEAVTEGVKRIFPEAAVRVIPIADGGEGTVEALVTAGGGKYLRKMATSPLGEPVEAVMGMLPDGTAVIEMAAASGLPLVPLEKRNPFITTTRGTGDLIKAALDEGARRILIGIGGSATNDGGAGMVQALGGKLLNQDGKELPPGGAALADLSKIDISGMDIRLKNVRITIICDVDNPLCGPRGASAVYGPQKGANPEMVLFLDRCLSHYAKVISNQLGIDIYDIPGAGAAGGLGAGLLAFTQAELKSGTEAILDTIKFNEMINDYDLVITGEGRIDGQSAFGKVPKGVGTRAQKNEKPVIAIVGSIGEGAEVMYDYGLNAIVPIVNRAMTLDEAVSDAYSLVVQTAERIFRLLQTGKSLHIG